MIRQKEDKLDEPLLEDDESGEGNNARKAKGIQNCRRSIPMLSTLIIFSLVSHALLLSLNILLFSSIRKAGERERLLPAVSIRSPADSAVRYTTQYFQKYGFRTSPFVGPPSPELDNAWHQLLAGMNIRVSEEYLTPYNAESLPLADDSGYAAQLGMYHELHCLKRIRQWLYKDHYYPNLREEEIYEKHAHIEHCLDWLRVAALCKGDTTLSTFGWEGQQLATEYPIPRGKYQKLSFGLFPAGHICFYREHEADLTVCVDSEHLLQWSLQHAINLSDPKVLKTPSTKDRQDSKSQRPRDYGDEANALDTSYAWEEEDSKELE